MFADMVGYTAAVQADEAGTLALVREQEQIVRPLLLEHHGREVKSTGDGFLAEFDSALHAMRCAVDIHQHLHDRNARPGVRPIRLRIGVHLGDVEEREHDIFGDAVNIAARIEPFAIPGGVCISGEVFNQVRNKVSNRFERLGPTGLKNVELPVDLYRVVMPWEATGPTVPEDLSKTRVAILPLANISPDPRDEYFADGLTEELISTVSKLRELTVIARTSVGQYKASVKSIAQIASELGVRSVLEGSVRKSGNRLRITVQLIDAATQGHLWAESYDRDLDDVFAVQAEIASRVAGALRIKLAPTAFESTEARPPVVPESYLAYLRGLALMHSHAATEVAAARAEFERAVELDPRNAAALAGLADAIRVLGWRTRESSWVEWDRTARGYAERAIQLAPEMAEPHTSLAIAAWDGLDYPTAEREFQEALALNPSYAPAHLYYAALLEEERRPDEALREFLLSEAADPLGVANLEQLSLLLTYLGRFAEADAKLQKLGALDPDGLGLHAARRVYYLALGETDRAAEECSRLEAIDPDPVNRTVYRAFRWTLSGRAAEARRALEAAKGQPGYGRIAFAVAEVFAELGDLDACFAALDVALEHRILPMQPLQLDPRRADVRADPRFRGLVERMHIPEAPVRGRNEPTRDPSAAAPR